MLLPLLVIHPMMQMITTVKALIAYSIKKVSQDIDCAWKVSVLKRDIRVEK